MYTKKILLYVSWFYRLVQDTTTQKCPYCIIRPVRTYNPRVLCAYIKNIISFPNVYSTLQFADQTCVVFSTCNVTSFEHSLRSYFSFRVKSALLYARLVQEFIVRDRNLSKPSSIYYALFSSFYFRSVIVAATVIGDTAAAAVEKLVARVIALRKSRFCISAFGSTARLK